MSHYYLILAFLGNSFFALAQNTAGGGADQSPLVVFANPNDPTLSLSVAQSTMADSDSTSGPFAALSIFSSALATFKTGRASASVSSVSPNAAPTLGNALSTAVGGLGSSSPASTPPGLEQSTRTESNSQSTILPLVPGGVFTPATASPSNSIQSVQTPPGTSTTETQTTTVNASSSLTQNSTVSSSSTTTSQDTTTTMMATAQTTITESPSSSSSLSSTSTPGSSSTGSTSESTTSSGVAPAATTAAPPAATQGIASSLSPYGAWYGILGVVMSLLSF